MLVIRQEANMADFGGGASTIFEERIILTLELS